MLTTLPDLSRILQRIRPSPATEFDLERSQILTLLGLYSRKSSLHGDIQTDVPVSIMIDIPFLIGSDPLNPINQIGSRGHVIC